MRGGKAIHKVADTRSNGSSIKNYEGAFASIQESSEKRSSSNKSVRFADDDSDREMKIYDGAI